jgi:CRP-like cAMP-binding protein
MPILQATTANLLLRARAPADYALLEPALARTDLPLRTSLIAADAAIERVYFPEGGVQSILTDQEAGEPVEYGMLGSEGMSGGPVLLGATQTPHRCFVQLNGATSLYLAADALVAACRESWTLQQLLLRFVHTLTVQAAATASANAHYALPERLARWLLMCHDRVAGDRLDLTHEFMSQMLAVRRSGVTVTLHTLEATGAIRSSRGLVIVLDRARLQEIAGDSYGSPEREYRRLIAPFGKS